VCSPDSAKVAVAWFEARLSNAIEQINDEMSKYRISDALMNVYKLFWDDFSSWYLEMIKPAYQQPIDAITYQATLNFFEKLVILLHPFMPFITEEVWQSLTERQAGDSIIIASMPIASEKNDRLVSDFEKVKQIIANVRTVRLERNIPYKDPLVLYVVSGEYSEDFNAVIMKMCNLSAIVRTDKDATCASFLVGTTAFAIPLESAFDIEEEIKKNEKEIFYLEGFLDSVMKKLGNEKFCNNAPPEVIANERKKQADAESKLNQLRITNYELRTPKG